MIDDVTARVEPDSGADVNVMDERQFKAFQHRTQKNVEFKKSKVKLSTLKNSLRVKGEFRTIVRNATRGIRTNFIVVKGKISSPPLLGKIH